MSPLQPLAAGVPDPLDLDANDEIERNEAGRLNIVRARAQHWIGGISALSGVLGTVLIVKGRESFTQITLGWRITIGAALAVALILLALATYCSYRAAFGSPDALAEIDPVPLTGLHARLLEARRDAATNALQDLSNAIRAVFAAVSVITLGVGITWFAPSGPPPSKSVVCIYSNGARLVQLSGESVAVRQSSPGASIGPCR